MNTVANTKERTTMAPETTQGQITLAIISTQITDLRTLVQQTNAKLDAVKECQDKTAYIPSEVKDLLEDVEQMKLDITQIRTATGIIGGLNATLATLGSAVSAFIGTR